MNRTVICLMVCLVNLATIQVHAVGVGIQGGAGYAQNAGTGGLWATVKIDPLPYIGLGINLWPHESYLGLTADWWLVHEKIAGPFSFYFGLGPYLGLHFYDPGYYIDAQPAFAFGARTPLGLRFFGAKWIELYLDLSPSIGFNFWGNGSLEWGVIGSLGARFWTD